MLTQILDHKGMNYEVIDENSISSAFSIELVDGTLQIFSLFILPIEENFDEGNKFFRFVIVPYIEQPLEGYSDELAWLLVQINHDLPQLKFAFDADGDLELLYDFPAEQLTYETFERSMQLLADYAAAYYTDLCRYS